VRPSAVIIGRAGWLVGNAPKTFVYMQALVIARALGGARALILSLRLKKVTVAKRSTSAPREDMGAACDGRMSKAGCQLLWQTVKPEGGASRCHPPTLKLI
jgi:hypothetical protein